MARSGIDFRSFELPSRERRLSVGESAGGEGGDRMGGGMPFVNIFAIPPFSVRLICRGRGGSWKVGLGSRLHGRATDGGGILTALLSTLMPSVCTAASLEGHGRLACEDAFFVRGGRTYGRGDEGLEDGG